MRLVPVDQYGLVCRHEDIAGVGIAMHDGGRTATEPRPRPQEGHSGRRWNDAACCDRGTCTAHVIVPMASGRWSCCRPFPNHLECNCPDRAALSNGQSDEAAAMDEKPFNTPVRVQLGSRGVRDVTSTAEAAELLASVDWPGERDRMHEDAVETCLKVLDGHRSTSDARNAFVEVAGRAGILSE